MKISGHTILITGGATGIGYALATRFLEADNHVIICGRREDALEAARAKHPALKIHTCDVSDPQQREHLIEWAFKEHPKLDVLVNNAGIQHRLDLLTRVEWPAIHREIATNLEACIHLALEFYQRVKDSHGATIVNVTSGLAFVPRSAVPVYCATKAAMHSFTQSLRDQLAQTPVEVVEIIPPAVDTDLGGPGLHTWGVPLDEFADAAFAQLKTGKHEVMYGFSEESSRASASERDALFARMNARR